MSNNCIKCASGRLLRLAGKTSDRLALNIGHPASPNRVDHEGYTPHGVGLGSNSDMVRLEFFLDCGQVQDEFPLPYSQIELDVDDEEELEDEFDPEA